MRGGRWGMTREEGRYSNLNKNGTSYHCRLFDDFKLRPKTIHSFNNDV
jgi:hypothetical protein